MPLSPRVQSDRSAPSRPIVLGRREGGMIFSYRWLSRERRALRRVRDHPVVLPFRLPHACPAGPVRMVPIVSACPRGPCRSPRAGRLSRPPARCQPAKAGGPGTFPAGLAGPVSEAGAPPLLPGWERVVRDQTALKPGS